MLTGEIQEYPGQKTSVYTFAQTSVTKDFLGLDKSIIDCQNKEPSDECKTRIYSDTFLKECGCLPISFSLSHPDQVCFYTNTKLVRVWKIIQY